MILVADGGATKTSWGLIKNEQEQLFFETEGYHPFYTQAEAIHQSLTASVTEDIAVVRRDITTVFFYSAGGGYSTKTDQVLIEGVGNFFSNARVVIETDLLGAARALLQREAGLAAILGTGSNSCLYDGRTVVENIESLGFYLGDEGSGAYIGKKIIGDYVRNRMPKHIHALFLYTYQLDAGSLLAKLYEATAASQYCATFALFAANNITDEYCTSIVLSAFDDFFRNIVQHYSDAPRYSFNAIGSIAFYFRDLLWEVAARYGFTTGNTLISAIDGLIQFHLGQPFTH